MARKPAKQKAFDPTLPIYQLKISLQHTNPLIWRRVQTDDCSLNELHEIIQIAMGWEDMHMHAFVIEGEEYGNPKRGGEVEYDSRFVRLSEILEPGRRRFRYDYDFGDDWKHIIDIEKTLPAEDGVRYPRCVKGERACPPEDCGGPYGYPYFLDKIQDPKHEEHKEALEWVGGEFDPEEFDLDEVNEELDHLRRWLGRRKGRNAPQAAFAKGDLVRVKPGIVHDQYPDIPLGGWVGKIKRIAWLTPIGYAVHWTKPTLDQAPAVYVKRCQRDDMKPHRCWLEEDQLESAADEMPTVMEQPTNITTRPLSMDEPDDRIRMVFGLTTDDALPKADEPTQRHFFDYLKTHLSFPFKAEYWPASALGPSKGGKVTVLGFSDPALDRKEGIVCEARKGNQECQVPLTGLHVNERAPNFQHVEDYTHWRWVATDVTTNPKVPKEIDRFFKKHGVKRVSMSAGNMGCPHEEGKDFPLGGDCPFCPWWKGKQGSGAQE